MRRWVGGGELHSCDPQRPTRSNCTGEDQTANILPKNNLKCFTQLRHLRNLSVVNKLKAYKHNHPPTPPKYMHIIHSYCGFCTEVYILSSLCRYKNGSISLCILHHVYAINDMQMWCKPHWGWKARVKRFVKVRTKGKEWRRTQLTGSYRSQM